MPLNVEHRCVTVRGDAPASSSARTVSSRRLVRPSRPLSISMHLYRSSPEGGVCICQPNTAFSSSDLRWRPGFSRLLWVEIIAFTYVVTANWAATPTKQFSVLSPMGREPRLYRLFDQ